MYRVAAVIVNYNMPEATDRLVRPIYDYVRWPVDLYVVDNGSDMVAPSEHTNVRIAKNVQTTAGWLRGLDAADLDAAREGVRHWAYWLISTSAEFVDAADTLTPLAQVLKYDERAVIVHPALQPNSGSVWRHMEWQGGDQPRRVHHADHIAMLVRADWFDGIGRLDSALYLAHGTCVETCWKARRDERTIWIHDGVRMLKHQDIGYKMGRMRMTAAQRNELAQRNMDDVLGLRYGDDYWRRLQEEYREAIHV